MKGDTMRARRTYPNLAAAIADPDSNAARVFEGFRAATRDREAFISAKVAEGYTPEEAWSEYLTLCRPARVQS